MFLAVATDGLEKFSMLTSTLYVAYLLYYWLVLVDDARIRGMGAAGLTSMVCPPRVTLDLY